MTGQDVTGGQPDHGALLQRALVALDEMESKLAASERRGHEPIAIVGIGLRFPGGAVDPDSFWELLTSGRDAVIDIPADRWDVEAMFDPNPDARAKSYTRWGGFLDDVDRFDPAFFGISPREALSMDPQQRILLEVAWEALEDAGIAATDLAGTATGVFIGMIGTEYSALALRGGVMDDVDAYFASGVAHSIAAGRLAYALDLRGPAVAVDTACSSSLVSTHMACQSLRSGESDIALAGGVNVMLSPDAHVMTSQARMMSFEGRCKTFDASADGYVRGEGCAFIVLKRLDDALAAGDHVVATIRGTAANQDGRTNGLTAPNAAAQEAVIRAALADGGVQPSEVGFVECHGTGTTLGDPIEIGALQSVFGAGRPADRPLRVQSVKTNIGHLEGAAGIAGLCKLALAVERGRLPAHLHLTEPNPYIPWRDIAVAAASGPEPWEADAGGRRIGGVSSFGFSGTNVHMILEEAPPVPVPVDAGAVDDGAVDDGAVDEGAADVGTVGLQRPRQVYVVSGRTPEALERVAAAHAATLERLAPTDWSDAAATAATGRAHLDERLAVVAGSAAEAAALLGHGGAPPTPDVVRGRRVAGDDGLVMLFTGQGSQRPGMGRRLYATEPAFRRTLDECAELFDDIGGFALLDAMFADASSAAGTSIHDTAYTQPCLFAYEVALAALWRSWGVEPAAAIGHSIGEYAAAHVAGVLSLGDALRLLEARGRLMQALPRDGGMAAVFADAETVAERIAPWPADLSIAAVNGPRNVVVSGRDEPLATVTADLEASGLRVVRLEVSHAFHSPSMEPMLDEFEQVVASAALDEPEIELISNRTGRVAEPGEMTTTAYWRRQVRDPVRFGASLRTAVELGFRSFLEVGPAPTLTAMARSSDLPADCIFAAAAGRDGDEADDVQRTLAALHVSGVPVDWVAYHRRADGTRHRPVRLPTYPFERQRFRHPAVVAGLRPGTRQATDGVTSLLGRRLRSPGLPGSVFETRLSAVEQAWLADRSVDGVAVVSPTVHLALVRLAAAACGRAGDDVVDVHVGEPLELPIVDGPDGRATVQTIVEDGGRVEIVSADGDGWRRHASAWLAPADPAPPAGAAGAAGAEGADDPAGAWERCAPPVEGVDHYAALERAGFVHGPAFRLIDRVGRRDGEVVANLHAPDAADAGDVHPALADACLQALGLAIPGVDATAGGSFDEEVHVPVAIGRWHVAAPAGSGAFTAHGRVQTDGDVASDVAGDVAGDVTGEIELRDGSGELVCRLGEVRYERVRRSTLRRRPAVDAELFYTPHWVPAAFPPDAAIGALAGRYAVVGSSGLAHDVAEQLVAAGAAATVVTIDELPGATLDGVAGVVWAVAPDDAPIAVAAHALGALVAALDGADSDAVVTVLTVGAMAAVPGDQVAGFESASSWGVVRVAAAEHPRRFHRLIDLSVDPEGEPDARAVQAVLAEIAADGRDEPEVAVRDGVRYVHRLARTGELEPVERATDDDVLPPWVGWNVDVGGAWIVTGGVGGLGLAVAADLAGAGAERLVLCSRRGVPDAAAADAIAALEAHGADVRLAAVDVADADAVRRVVADAVADGMRLTGVVHAAGVLDDGLLPELTVEQYERVMAPKVLGAHNLLEACDPHGPDHVVLFSAGAAVLGAAGQANYAAANATLDALAYRRRALGLPAQTIDWGPWRAVGMAARLGDTALRRWESQGIVALDPEEGTAALRAAIAGGAPQLAIMRLRWPALVHFFSKHRVPPLLRDLVKSEQRAAVGVGDVAERTDLVAELGELRPDQRRGRVVDEVRRQLLEVLGLDPQFPVDAREGFTDLGLDSLMAVELSNRLSVIVDETFPATLAFEQPTLELLSAHVIELLSGRVAFDQPGGASHEGAADDGPDGIDELTASELTDALLSELDEAGY